MSVHCYSWIGNTTRRDCMAQQYLTQCSTLQCNVFPPLRHDLRYIIWLYPSLQPVSIPTSDIFSDYRSSGFSPRAKKSTSCPHAVLKTEFQVSTMLGKTGSGLLASKNSTKSNSIGDEVPILSEVSYTYWSGPRNSSNPSFLGPISCTKSWLPRDQKASVWSKVAVYSLLSTVVSSSLLAIL